MRFLPLTLSFILVQLLASPLAAQVAVEVRVSDMAPSAQVTENSYILSSSDERLIEVSSAQPGLWLHLEPVDGTGESLEPSRPVCAAPCSTRRVAGLWAVSVSTSEGRPVRAPGVITLDRDLHLMLDYTDNTTTRVVLGIGVTVALIYAVTAVIVGSVISETSREREALLGTGITAGLLGLGFLGFAFTFDEAGVRVLQ